MIFLTICKNLDITIEMHTQKGFVEYTFICDIRSSFVIISQYYWTKFDRKKLEKHIKPLTLSNAANYRPKYHQQMSSSL